MKKILRSIRLALKGLQHAFVSDKSFRMEIYYGLPIYLIVGWLLLPLTPTELIVYIGTYALILLVELMNTAFETMLDRLHPEKHVLIGKSKDIASAAVLVAFIFALVVVAILASTRLTSHGAFVLGSAFV